MAFAAPKRLVISFLLVLFLAYVGLCALLFARQKGMIYYPTREIEGTPADIGLEYEDLTLRTPDGVAVSAWYVPAADAKAAVLFCHGNGGNISHRLDTLRMLHQLNLSVLIFDYRGYGKSEGSPGEEGTYLDAEAAWEFLVVRKHIAPDRIILFGRSLGGAVAAETALRRKAGGLIVESSFTSVADLGRKMFPYLPVKLLVLHKYDTIGKIGRIAIPKLFIHSAQDELIPFGHGRELYEKAAEPKQFLEIAGDHNSGFMTTGERYVEALRSFTAGVAGRVSTSRASLR